MICFTQFNLLWIGARQNVVVRPQTIDVQLVHISTIPV